MGGPRSITIRPSWLRQRPASQPLGAVSSTWEMQVHALSTGLGLVRTWGPRPSVSQGSTSHRVPAQEPVMRAEGRTEFWL